MSRFQRLSHTIWNCQYHVVWVPKYRYPDFDRPRKGNAGGGNIRSICGFAGCEVVELNVQPDHVHLLMQVPPKVVDIAAIGSAEGSDGNESISPISAFEKEALLGQSFLGQGLLRGYGGSGCGYDTQVCPLSREERAISLEQMQLID